MRGRCISYLTIELREPILDDLLRALAIGCSAATFAKSLSVERRVPLATEAGFEPVDGMNPLELPPLFFLDDAAFLRDSVTHRCVAHQTPRLLLRNAAVATWEPAGGR